MMACPLFDPKAYQRNSETLFLDNTTPHQTLINYFATAKNGNIFETRICCKIKNVIFQPLSQERNKNVGNLIVHLQDNLQRILRYGLSTVENVRGLPRTIFFK